MNRVNLHQIGQKSIAIQDFFRTAFLTHHEIDQVQEKHERLGTKHFYTREQRDLCGKNAHGRRRVVSSLSGFLSGSKCILAVVIHLVVELLHKFHILRLASGISGFFLLPFILQCIVHFANVVLSQLLLPKFCVLRQLLLLKCLHLGVQFCFLPCSLGYFLFFLLFTRNAQRDGILGLDEIDAKTQRRGRELWETLLEIVHPRGQGQAPRIAEFPLVQSSIVLLII
jgi:hypothetical protein